MMGMLDGVGDCDTVIDTTCASLSPCDVSAVFSLALRALPFPRLDRMPRSPEASTARIFVSTTTLEARRSRASVIDRISTLAAVVPAAVAMAFLYFARTAASNST